MSADQAGLAASRLTVDLSALVANWRMLHDFAPGAEVAAMVKADAYGLGAAKVAPALAQAGCRTFFSAFPGEAIVVREAAPAARIFVLAGLFTDNASAHVEHRLIPVLNDFRDLELWRDTGARLGRRLACALNFDTGMNRLGFRPQDASRLADAMRFAGVDLALVMSHFACSDTPAHDKNAAQKAAFGEVRGHFPGVPASLANSGAILTDREAALDLVRPGIALYGGSALTGSGGTPSPGPVRPVVTFEARIAQVRRARAGETVGYGATATLKRDSRIAIACAGYADGYFRAASGSGVPMRGIIPGAHGAIGGHAVPLLGRVSMDLAAFDVTDLPEAALAAAQWIELIGDAICLDDFATAAGTIGYEVLTGIGRRAERVYQEIP